MWAAVIRKNGASRIVPAIPALTRKTSFMGRQWRQSAIDRLLPRTGSVPPRRPRTPTSASAGRMTGNTRTPPSAGPSFCSSAHKASGAKTPAFPVYTQGGTQEERQNEIALTPVVMGLFM